MNQILDQADSGATNEVAAKSSEKLRTIGVVLLPEFGAYNASLPICRNLKGRGFRVVYLSIPAFEAYLTRQGFEVVMLVHRDDVDADSAVADLKGWRRIRERVRLRALGYMKILERIRTWIRANSPGLVLLDPLVASVTSPFLEFGIPIVGFNTTFASVFQSHVPAVFTTSIPSEKGVWHERVQFSWNWLRIVWPHYRMLWSERFGLFSVFGPVRWRQYQQNTLVRLSGGILRCGEYGFRLRTTELMAAPREFDFPKISKWTGRFYAGACVDTSRHDEALAWRGIQKDRFLVYCSLGTYSKEYRYSRQIFHALVDAAKRRDDWQVIVQVGEAVDPNEFGVLPERLLVAKWVPQLEVLQYASVFVTHGGLGSVREAAYYGVPMIVFPVRLDQPGNAARVVYHGLGVRADKSKVTPRQMGQLIDQVAHDNMIRHSVQKMQQAFRKQEDYSKVTDVLERFFADTHQPL